MRYVSLLFLLSCSVFLHAMDDEQPEIIKHDLGDYAAKSAAFSMDGTRMVVAFENREDLYHCSTGEQSPFQVATAEFHNSIGDVSMIPGSNNIVTRFDNGIGFVAAVTKWVDRKWVGRETSYSGENQDQYNAWGDRLRVIREKTILIDHEDGSRHELESEDRIGYARLSDKKGYVATVLGYKHGVQVWDYRNKVKILDKCFDRGIYKMCFDPEGDKLFVSLFIKDSGGHKEGAVWDIKTGEQLYELPYIASAKFVDDKLVGTSSISSNSFSLIEASTGRILNRMPNSMMRISSCVFSPNNKYFAQLGLGKVRVYDTEGTGNLIALVDSQAEVDTIKAVSPQGDCMVVTTRQNKTVLLSLANLMRKKSNAGVE